METKKQITIDTYEVLKNLKEEAMKWLDNNGFNNRIVARLWFDGDITYDYSDGNFHPINEEDYFEIAKSDSFYRMNDTLGESMQYAEDELDWDYLEYLKNDIKNNNDNIKRFEELLEDANTEEIVEYVEENDAEWYENWREEVLKSTIAAMDFAHMSEGIEGREFIDFCERHNIEVIFN